MSFSEAEARIRRLMSRMSDDELRLSVVQDRILRTRQDLAGFYQVGAGRGCTTTVQGKVTGTYFPQASFPGIPGATVRLVGSVTGTDYGTYTTDSNGLWSAEITGLTQSGESGILHAYVDGPGPRFAESGPKNLSYTECQTNIGLPAFAPDPATGYHYLGGGCMWPIKDVLTFEEPILYGTHTVTRTPGISGTWSGFYCTAATSRSSTAGGSPVATAIIATFDDTPQPNFAYPAEFLSARPYPSSCPSPAGPRVGAVIYGISFTKTLTCPDLSTLFHLTWTGTVPADHIWYPPGPITIDFYET